MTDKTQNDTAQPEADVVQLAKPTAQVDAAPAAPKAPSQKGIWIVLILAVLGLAAGGAFLWQTLQQLQSTTDRQLAQQQSQQSVWKEQQDKQQTALEQKLQAAQAAGQTQQQSLDAFSQRLNAQNKRLLALSTTTREDWLLAEVEYLLRLANQRILINRDPLGAEVLLAESDNILKGLDDPDLFPLRETIAKERMALRMVGKFDREGMFIKLNALTEAVEQLSLIKLPEMDHQPYEAPELAASAGWRDYAEQGVVNVKKSFASYFRIQNHAQAVNPVLSAQDHRYLKQNLRFMLEQAQLGLLREEPQVYQRSLAKAADWIKAHYQLNREGTQAVLSTIVEYRKVRVEQPLPDITASLEQLRAYIEKLHNLQPLREVARAAAEGQQP